MGLCKLRAVVLSFLLLQFRLQAQTISGSVSTGYLKPLSSATVALLSDSVLLAITTTNDTGNFEFTQVLKLGKSYTLRVSCIGYQPLHQPFTYKKDLPPFQLVVIKDTSMLKEVSVMARRSLITRRSDRYIIHVENSFLSEEHSAIEILQKSPGVWVDNRGRIFLHGTRPVTVIVNDVVQRMSGDELTDYLRSLRSADISSIEIIAQPPAQFESEGAGGIVRIILKGAGRSGFNGALNAQYRQQGEQPYFTTGASLNYGAKRIYLTGTYNYTMDKRSMIEKAAIYSPGNRYDNLTDRFEKVLRHQYRFALIYDLGAKGSFGLQSTLTKTSYPAWFRSHEQYWDTLGSGGSSASQKQRRFDLRSVTFNYALTKHKASFKLIGDYTDNHKWEKNNYLRERFYPAISTVWRNDVPIATKVLTLQADYHKSLCRSSSISSGIKYANVDRNNQLLTQNLETAGWKNDTGKSNHFQYWERLFMAYASFERLKKYTSIKAGLRGEETVLNGNVNEGTFKFKRNYFRWFPSVFIMQTLDSAKGSAIAFAYNRRITRPALSDLNPARLEYNYYTSLKGNPALLPEDSHNFSLSGAISKAYRAELYFTHTIHSIGLSAYSGLNSSIDYISENSGTNNQWGLSFNSSHILAKLWTVSANLGLDHAAYRFNGIAYHQFSFRAKILQNLGIAHFVDLDLSLDFYSPYRYTNLYTYGNFATAAGVSKKLLKDKMRLRLEFNDIFNTTREKELTVEGDSRVEFYRKRATRTIMISCTYNFNKGKKVNAKRIEQGSAEERARIGN